MKRAVDLDLGLPVVAASGPAFKPAPLFTDFCAQIGVELEPGQRVACRVAFDGVDPCDLEPEEREIARDLFGDIDSVAEVTRRIVVAVCGARGGKTYVFGALRLLHLALTVPIGMLAPGEVASAPLIAPDMDLATQALRYVQGAVLSVPALASMVIGKPDAAESIDIARDGRIVEIVVRSASGRGRTGRGRSLVGAVMEESGFFKDKDYAVNDEEIFQAITPRLLPGAQLVISSTPWAQVGLLYDLFTKNHPNPKCAGVNETPRCEGTALAFHATTLRLRDTPFIREMVKAEREINPENTAREYDAQFMSADASTFFDPLTLAKCIDDSIEIPFLPEPGDEVASGADLGFVKNSSALVVTHRRERNISVADIVEKKPQEGAALKPSEVVKEFADVIVKHHGSYLMADGHYKETAVEHLGSAGLGFLEAPSSPADAFIAVRAAMREDRVRLPNHPRLVRQLRETMSKRSSGGNLTIVLPRWKTGEHGDIAAAFVLAVYQAAGETVPAPKPKSGSPEAFAAEAAAITSKRRQEVRRQHEGGDSFVSRWPRRA